MYFVLAKVEKSSGETGLCVQEFTEYHEAVLYSKIMEEKEKPKILLLLNEEQTLTCFCKKHIPVVPENIRIVCPCCGEDYLLSLEEDNIY